MPFAMYAILTSGAGGLHWYLIWKEQKGERRGDSVDEGRNVYGNNDGTEHMRGSIQYDPTPGICGRVSCTMAGRRRCSVFWHGAAIVLDFPITIPLAYMASFLSFLFCE